MNIDNEIPGEYDELKEPLPTTDGIIDILIQKVEEMNKRDKTGLSLVEIYEPYLDLYNWSMLKMSQLTKKTADKT